MVAVKASRSIGGLADPTDFDRAWWINRAEFCRDHPGYLGYLHKAEPELYEFHAIGLRTLAIEARSEEWRDPREGIGGRPEQLIPGTEGSFSDRTDWSTFLLMGGRGSGKSRTGAEAVRELLYGRTWRENPRVAFVGQTLESVRIDMIENTFLKVVPESSVIKWNRSTCELWLDIGGGRVAYIKGYSSDAARKLRGPNFHLAWADEIATWTDAHRSPAAPSTTWSNMRMAVRLDDMGTWTPRVIATSTPKVVNLIRNFDEEDPENPGKGVHDDDSTVVSAMSTLENADNLSDQFIRDVIAPLEGTRLYRQEVEGELLDEAIGAQWSEELCAAMTRTEGWPEVQAGGLRRVVVAVDPSIGAGLGDECGIVVVGLAKDGNAYVLEDGSFRGRAALWCAKVEALYVKWGASVVVVEENQGGELVDETLGQYAPNLPITTVHAKEGKKARAEPVAVLSEQQRVYFAGPRTKFAKLQLQLRTWEGSTDSPDRLDAFVYGVLCVLPPRGGTDDLFKTTRGGARRRQPVG